MPLPMVYGRYAATPRGQAEIEAMKLFPYRQLYEQGQATRDMADDGGSAARGGQINGLSGYEAGGDVHAGGTVPAWLIRMMRHGLVPNGTPTPTPTPTPSPTTAPVSPAPLPGMVGAPLPSGVPSYLVPMGIPATPNTAPVAQPYPSASPGMGGRNGRNSDGSGQTAAYTPHPPNNAAGPPATAGAGYFGQPGGGLALVNGQPALVPKGSYASGGAVKPISEGFLLHRLARGSGLVRGISPGRADKVTTAVPKGSYIIPADVVSGMGQGNTASGASLLGKMIHGAPKIPTFARGGTVQMVPVRLSAGEYHIHPHHVARLGGGSMKQGAAKLDRLIETVRRKSAKAVRKMPDPR